MNDREFWARVDALLDDCRDPLDDEAVERHLARDPRAVDQYVRLTRTLRSLPRSPSGRLTRRTIAALAVGAAVLVALVAYIDFASDAPEAPVVTQGTSASSVLSFKISVVRESNAARSSTTIENDRRTDSREGIAVEGLATLITTYHRESTP